MAYFNDSADHEIFLGSLFLGHPVFFGSFAITFDPAEKERPFLGCGLLLWFCRLWNIFGVTFFGTPGIFGYFAITFDPVDTGMYVI